MPSHLHGLNLIHPRSESTGSAEDLLSGPSFPEFNAQLDLWTNLAFESDEPAAVSHEHNKYNQKQQSLLDELEQDTPLADRGDSNAAIRDGHVNVVTGRNLPQHQNLELPHAQQHQAHLAQLQAPTEPSSPAQFDLNAFLAGFGIDSFAAPPEPSQAPSLAQLLALHGQSNGGTIQPFTTTKSPVVVSSTTQPPPAKRARTRKGSVATSSPSSSAPATSPVEAADPEDDYVPNPLLSVAEDKRRRNTAASARFRLKKKEREAALEGKAKELEGRVSELERECEGLRRENGWLKGLVVGVTGANVGPAPTSVSPVTGKRAREEDI